MTKNKNSADEKKEEYLKIMDVSLAERKSPNYKPELAVSYRERVNNILKQHSHIIFK